jgi:hypothetical protein
MEPLAASSFEALATFLTKRKIWPQNAHSRNSFLASPLVQNLTKQQMAPKHVLVLYLSYCMFRPASAMSASKANFFKDNTVQQNMDLFMVICKDYNGNPPMEEIVDLLEVVRERLSDTSLWVWEGLFAQSVGSSAERKSFLVGKKRTFSASTPAPWGRGTSNPFFSQRSVSAENAGRCGSFQISAEREFR